MEDKVSVIIPVYNKEKYLKKTYDSVNKQTYKNLEIIFIDDNSSDNSLNIMNEIKKNDERVKIIKNKKNIMVAKSRNKGIKESTGRYIAFLDADDKWASKKIEKQVNFMREKDIAFSYTGYQFLVNDKLKSIVKVKDKLSYKKALGNTEIFTSTVMLDMKKLTKQDIYMVDVFSEDTATWWKILKKIDYAYGLNETLSFYRVGDISLSSNKKEAIKRIWRLYRNVEHINILSSSYYFIKWAFNAVKRRI